MKEGDFIRQNQHKWKEFEKLLQHEGGSSRFRSKGHPYRAAERGKEADSRSDSSSAADLASGNDSASAASVASASAAELDPRRLSNLYVQITDDLAYARTFYANRSVRAYLNALSRQIYRRVQRRPRSTMADVLYFWQIKVPSAFWHARREALISLLVFLGAVLIGLLSSFHDPGFASHILGDSYVEMTERNIAAGEPMKVYDQQSPMEMFYRIAMNNLFVDMLTFCLGLLYAVGTLFVLLYNGVMVGTFQYFFVEFDLLGESALSIWQHGTIEMSALVWSGAAGLCLGRGLLFPGTHTRLQSLRLSARMAFVIMAPVVVMTLVAAGLESWVTRQTTVPDVLRMMVILGSLLLVLGYTVVYPRLLALRGLSQDFTLDRLPPQRPLNTRLDVLRSSAETVSLAFHAYAQRFRPMALALAALAAILGLLAAKFLEHPLLQGLSLNMPPPANGLLEFVRDFPFYLKLSLQFSLYRDYPWLAPLNVLLFSMLFAMLARVFDRFPNRPQSTDPEQNTGKQKFSRQFFAVFVGMSIVHSTLFLPAPWGHLLFLLLLPLSVLWACSVYWEGRTLLTASEKAWRIMMMDVFQYIAICTTLLLLSMIVLALANSPILGFFTEILVQNLPLSLFDEGAIPAFLIVFISYFSFYLVLPLGMAACCAHYFHARELNEGQGIATRMQGFGRQKTVPR